MTVAKRVGQPARRWLTAGRAGLLLLLLAGALVAPQLRSGTELVRARHALVLGPELGADADWRPPAWPAGFQRESVPADPYFIDVARSLRLTDLADDWDRTLAISAHLLGSGRKRTGGAIQQDLRTTHRRIVEQGHGYCGDYVRVFTAIANAAGMIVRPWAFSFDGFGGQGHIWVEVWNRQRQAWQLADVFHNYQFVLGDDEPLSALRARAALAANDPALQLRPLDPAARPGWSNEAMARAYLRRGVAEWYVPWGNNVMSIDRNPLVRGAGKVSRALEGLAAIATGLQPQIRVLATAENAAQRASMQAVRLRLGAAALAGFAGIGLLGVALARRKAVQVPSTPPAAGWPRVCVVGPLPPPSGGMANQCEQLVRLLRDDGVSVELVRTNPPYRPAVVGRVPGLRALVRLVPYLIDLWRKAGRCEVVHVLANSGWAWHLFAAPAVWVAALRRRPVVVNYRGGLADEFLARAPAHVHRALRRAALCVTPSNYLRRVFELHGLHAEVIPNVIDTDRFVARRLRAWGPAPHIVVARNLEPIYGLDTAIRALALLRQHFPQATLTLAGTGPQRDELLSLAESLGLADAVHLPGRIDHADMPALYARADVALNPSTVDNMPNSVLEAHASRLPLVSTHVGGVPDIVEDGRTGLLVPPSDPQAMAEALRRVLDDPALAEHLVLAAHERVQAYAWPRVRQQWLSAYRRAGRQEAMA